MLVLFNCIIVMFNYIKDGEFDIIEGMHSSDERLRKIVMDKITPKSRDEQEIAYCSWTYKGRQSW